MKRLSDMTKTELIARVDELIRECDESLEECIAARDERDRYRAHNALMRTRVDRLEALLNAIGLLVEVSK